MFSPQAVGLAWAVGRGVVQARLSTFRSLSIPSCGLGNECPRKLTKPNVKGSLHVVVAYKQKKGFERGDNLPLLVFKTLIGSGTSGQNVLCSETFFIESRDTRKHSVTLKRATCALETIRWRSIVIEVLFRNPKRIENVHK